VPADTHFGARLARVDERWTHLESVLCAGVLSLEVGAFSFWIALKGISMGSGASRAGLAFRAAFGVVLFGFAVSRVMRDRPPRVRSLAVLLGATLGAFAGRASGDLGVTYFSNVLNWLQDSSFLTLLGGLRGVGTELTWWLAMLGASLATGTGKHINIDALLRFIRPKMRMPAVLFGWVTAAVVCLVAVWGFFDHIAIGSFGAPADADAGEKVTIAVREGGRHLFLLRKQLALDTRTVLHVLKAIATTAGSRAPSGTDGSKVGTGKSTSARRPSSASRYRRVRRPISTHPSCSFPPAGTAGVCSRATSTSFFRSDFSSSASVFWFGLSWWRWGVSTSRAKPTHSDR
jgi:hypothetical protein